MTHYTQTEEFDGVFVPLHGATCCVSEDDACGAFLGSLVGNKPIAAACDLHAKITPRMLRNADVICGYQTYPHVDLFNTGRRTARQLLTLLSGKQLRMATKYADDTTGMHFCCDRGWAEQLNPGNFSRSIDHILVKDVKVFRYERYNPDYFFPLTDHSPLWIDAEI